MEFELYFIDPTTITSAWHDTAPQILPEHIMSFSMTKNVFSGKLPNGGVASSTMSLTIDNSGGEYTQYLTNSNYWIFVANPYGQPHLFDPDFITAFHLDSVSMNQNKFVSISGFDAIDLLDKYTVSSEDIKTVVEGNSPSYKSVLDLMDFTGLGFKVKTDVLRIKNPDLFPITEWLPTGEISYRQLCGWVAEACGYILEVSGEFENNVGLIIDWLGIWNSNYTTPYPGYPNGTPALADYAFYYDNEDDLNRPPSFISQTRDLVGHRVTGVRWTPYNGDSPRLQGNENGYVIEVTNNPFYLHSFPPSVQPAVSWGGLLRHNTSAPKEAFVSGGFWYGDSTPTQLPLRKRYHADTMCFINFNPHVVDAPNYDYNGKTAYGDFVPAPISSYTYVCNGLETVNCDIESDTASQLTPQMTPTDTAIQELQKNVQIVDSGTDNGWEYKKYSDGTYDAYKRLTLSAVACSTTWGSMYVTAAQTFGNRPSFDAQGMQIFVTYMSSDGHSGWATNWGGVSGTGTGTWVIIRPTSSTSLSGYLSAHIHSNWA